MTNRFTPPDNDPENSLFDEEWYNKVSRAINYTFEILEKNNTRTIVNKDSLAKAIIDYNIEKKLAESASKLPLPNTLVLFFICEHFSQSST